MMSIIAANLKLNGYEKGIGVNVLDLFSGIGGFSLGLESTGFFKTVGFCEQDKFCQKVLRKHWKDVPIYEDIKTLDARKIQADVVVGGFPCQSFSIAGKQKGKDDERYLWDEMFRVIKEAKPRWIIGENVQNLTNISNGQILQGIHNDLESQGYEVQTFNISASSQGAWHKRARIWIVAANTKKNVWNSESTGLQSSFNRQRKREFWRTSTPREQCQRTWWQIESELCGVPDGVSATMDKGRANRIKALGNSIVPQIIKEIGLAIYETEK